jgi:hypothetical protein
MRIKSDEEAEMYEYEGMILHKAKQDELLKNAERERLATVARGGSRRFRLIGWRFPVIRFRPFALKWIVRQEVTRIAVR